MDSVAEADRAFATDLYPRLGEATGNLVFSPYSVASALRMTAYGARGRTAEEMADVLHLADLAEAVASAGETAARLDDLRREAVELQIADTVWVQSGLRLEQDYVEALRRGHDATLRQADFRHAPEPARKEINRAIEDATLGHIKDLLAEGTIDRLSRLVLTNAIYLKAAWATPFAKHATRDAPFHHPDGSTLTVSMMQATEQYGYARGDGFQAVQLPYEGGRLAMTVLLPAGPVESLERRLTQDGLHTLLGRTRPAQIDLTLPRFRVRTHRRLNADLQSLGMVEAFENRADFTGITRDEPLLVSHVAHEAYVDVDEYGTEAAAATAVVFRTIAMRIPAARVVVDRPFLFAITDTATGLPLFLGRVTDPSGRG
ncbi:MAG: serpin family protein [Streptomycetales bacterium]